MSGLIIKKQQYSFFKTIPAFVTAIFLSSSYLQAAPGVLADQPLSLVTSTKPNILLILDDSGSMDGEAIITDEARSIHNDEIDGSGRADNRTAIETDRELWRLCAGYNSLAFNPEVEYEKWSEYPGRTFEDSQGNDLTSVLENPLDLSGSDDLSDHIYIRWDDEDGDNRYDYNTAILDGECGPGVVSYDLQAGSVVAFPETGTVRLTPAPGSARGVLTDSNSSNGTDYSVTDDGVVVIDIPGGGDATSSDFLTFEVNFFNVDRFASDTDSLVVRGGIDTAPAVTNGVTVTQLFDFAGGIQAISPTDTYTTPDSPSANAVSDSLTLNDSFAGNRNNEIRQFIVRGSQATLVFDGGSNAFTRSGFSVSWAHSSAAGAIGNGIVSEDDCIDGPGLHCVRVDSLPLTEADALANPTTASKPYNTRENYANWYTYYRKRDYVAKKALGDLVLDSEYRLGFSTINDNGDGGVIIKDVENTSEGVITAEKTELLQKIYSTRRLTNKGTSSSGTPLLRALSNAGRYFNESGVPESNFLGTTFEGARVPSEHFNNDAVLNINTPILDENNGGQCQQNFALLFTDGARGDLGSTYEGTGHDVNGGGAGFVGNVDGMETGDGDGSGDGDGDLTGGIYGDQLSDGLSDLAMYYFINDLSATLPDDLALNLHRDTIRHQHMVTFAIGFGVGGDDDSLLGTRNNIGASRDADGGWPTTFGGQTSPAISSTENLISDLRHASFNSRGEYLQANNVEELQQSLDDIISEITVRLDNTATGASFSAFELAAGGFRYDTTYNNVIWWGDLRAFAFDAAQDDSFADVPSWSADTVMRERGDNRHIASDEFGRQIITYNRNRSSSIGGGIAFQFPADFQNPNSATELNPIQIQDLLTNTIHVNLLGEPDNSASGNATRNQAYGGVLVDYLRGSSALDNETLSYTLDDGEVVNSHVFRDREEHYIGALIHSQPLFVGAPSNNYPDDIEQVSYSSFRDDRTHSNRREMIYVGGNDGMLHGFYARDESDLNPDGGEEVFAYIPQLISNPEHGGRGLNSFALGNYDGAPYVDGSPVVADVFVDRVDVGDSSLDALYEAEMWRSYLVGGFRAGARGLYVLDVTNPDANNAPNISHPKLSEAESVANRIVVNEFTHPQMGHIYGRPRIGKMNNGRWAAIVGNGYNSSSEGKGSASLFIVYLDRPTEGNDPNDSDSDGIYNDGFGDYSIITASENTWIQCAEAGDECNIPEASQVRYGQEGSFSVGNEIITANVSFICDAATFGRSFTEGDVCQYSDNNGLSEPAAIDLDNDGVIDRVYAGDLHGNMWIFDVSSTGGSELIDGHTDAANDWQVHSENGEAFFTACSTDIDAGEVCPRADRQPITTRPLITNNPIQSDSATDPNTLVFFGSGQYLTDADQTNTSVQSFFGIWDAGSGASALTSANLTAQTINQITDDERLISSQAVNYSYVAGRSDNMMGWYFNSLPIERERVVLRPLIFGNILVFQTLIPTQGMCNARAGSGFIMAVDPLTGGNPSFNVLGANGGLNVAGKRVGSVIVGSSITRSADGEKLNVKTADGKTQQISLVPSEDNLSNFKQRGRKSWSILQ